MLASFRSTILVRLLAVAVTPLLGTVPSRAHTVSIGYENAGPGAVTFWYGSYHAGTPFTEGSLQLVGPGINTTVPFSSLVHVMPAGLVDGTTNFYSDGTALVGSVAASSTGLSAVSWQGVTFTGLTTGSYTFTYIPILVPTAEWEPIDAVILSSTVNLTSAVIGGSVSLVPFASTINQTAVAAAIDATIGAGGTGFPDLSSLPPGALPGVLAQLTGEAATGVQAALLQMMNPFLVLMIDPFAKGRNGTGPALSFAAEPSLRNTHRLAYDAVTPKSADDDFAHRWTMWSAAYGGKRRTGGELQTIGSHDSRTTAGGAAAGLDYRFGHDTVAGFALSGGSTSWSLDYGLGGGDSDVFQAGVYASTRFGNFFVTGALAYASHRIETERTVSVMGTDQLSAHFNASSYGLRLEGGYRFEQAGYEITPYAAFQAQALRIPAYSEYASWGSNAFALEYNEQTPHAARTELGLWLGNTIALADGTSLTLRTRAAWAHDWAPDTVAFAAFQLLPGSNFVVQGAKPPSDSAVTSLALDLGYANGLSLSVKLDGEFSRHAQTYAATGNVRYAW